MSRRSSIRLSSTVTPEKPKDDPTILYCNYDNCPLNSLYQCTYCKCYRCIRHAKIMDNNTYTCKSDNLLDAFLILGYDVVFEIGIAYITFYNIFIVSYNNFIQIQ